MGNAEVKQQENISPEKQEDETPISSPSQKNTQNTRYAHITEKVGVIVIGTGQRMCSLLRYLLADHGELIQILAICDESEAAMKSAAEHLWMFPAFKDAPRYTDYKEILKIENAKWVLIGSRNSLHCEHCISSFEAGKNVFCEKPLAITIDQCAKIREAQQKSGKLFATGFVLRHAPFYKKIHELVSTGQLGKLVSVEANELLNPYHGAYIMRNWRRFRNQSGSHLLEKCCHDIDILNWIVGSVPSRVASFAGLDSFLPQNRPENENDRDYHEMWGAYEKVDAFTSEKDIEDNQVAIIEYCNGVRATFHTNSNTAMPQRRLVICGVKGTIQADLLKGRIKFRQIGANKPLQKFDMGAKDMHGGADEIIMSDLAKCIETECKPQATGEEGFLSALACLATDEAYLNGSVVNVKPLWDKFGVETSPK